MTNLTFKQTTPPNSPAQMIIWSQAFDLLLQEIEQAAVAYAGNPKSILTETDLQCILYGRFSEVLRNNENTHLHVHTETSFLDRSLDDGGKLILKPDLAVIDHNEIDIRKGSDLYPRKGYTLWGSCLAFELKFNRTKHIRACEQAWKDDIDKLSVIRTEHYDNTAEQFHGAFVLFSRPAIPESVKDELVAYGTSKGIEVRCCSATDQQL